MSHRVIAYSPRERKSSEQRPISGAQRRRRPDDRHVWQLQSVSIEAGFGVALFTASRLLSSHRLLAQLGHRHLVGDQIDHSANGLFARFGPLGVVHHVEE